MELTNELKVQSYQTDYNGHMGLVPLLTIVQDNMCEFFERLGCDGFTMIPIKNCFFVLTKTKIKIHDYLKWLDVYKVRTYLTKVSPLRVNLETQIFDKNSCVMASAIQEMCAIDKDSRKAVLVKNTLLPNDVQLKENLSDLLYQKFDEELSECFKKETREIKLSNIDMFRHVNNVEYVKIMLDNVPLEIIENHLFETLEIHYIKECKLNDSIDIYLSEKEKDSLYFEIKSGDNVITKARFELKDK